MVTAIGRGRTPQIMLGTKINVILRASDSRWLHNNYHQLLLIEGIFLHQISFPSRLFLIRWCYLQSFPQHNRQFCSEITTATCKNAKLSEDWIEKIQKGYKIIILNFEINEIPPVCSSSNGYNECEISKNLPSLN